MQVLDPLDYHTGQDLLEDDEFNKVARTCTAKDVDWLHMAPPCRTFTKARRNDKHGKVRTMRTAERPEGDPEDAEAVKANLLANRCAALAIQQWKRGAFFSIENPLQSFIWDLKLFRRLALLPGVRLVQIDQCAFGSEHKKPTGVLTNAPWIGDKACQSAPPHTHTVLEGKVWSYKMGKMVWYTSEAAEYPAAMCEAWARDWVAEDNPRDEAKADRQPVGDQPSLARGPRQEPRATVSAKTVRELENDAAIGGMRNPNEAVSRSKSWQALGDTIRRLADEALDDDDTIPQLLEKLRAGENLEDQPFFMQCVEAAGEGFAAALCKHFWLGKEGMVSGPSGWRWRLMEHITQEAEDEDVDVASWMQGSTPLGISEPIPSRGIFPACEASKAQEEAAEFLQKKTSNEVYENYASFSEHSPLAKKELERLISEGHLEKIGSWTEVLKRWPDAIATKLAVLVKEKSDGSIKVRFIVDMLRSGINGMVTANERIVLPRGHDLITSTLNLWRDARPGDEIEFLVADIKDAFLLLKIAEHERGFTIITDGEDYYAYSGVPFGLASAPLLWGRVSAWLGRLAQAISQPSRLRTQLYVDDPILACIGSEQARTRGLARVVLTWLALGARFAWHKAMLSKSVEWIGATYATSPGEISAAISEKRIQKIDEEISKHLAAKGMTRKLDSIAGELSWVAGIVPRLRPFVRMLYGAIHSMHGAQGGRNRPKDLIFLKTVEFPLTWLQKFFKGHLGGLRRVHYLSDTLSLPSLKIRTDASTTGVGAILLSMTDVPMAWMADIIRIRDLELFGATKNDPKWMAEFELLAVLLAFHAWRDRLRGHRVTLILQTDSQAAKGALDKLSSASPICNALAAELSLLQEFHNIHLLTDHIRTEINLEADALSRLAEGSRVPACLRGIKATPAPDRQVVYQLLHLKAKPVIYDESHARRAAGKRKLLST